MHRTQLYQQANSRVPRRCLCVRADIGPLQSVQLKIAVMEQRRGHPPNSEVYF